MHNEDFHSPGLHTSLCNYPASRDTNTSELGYTLCVFLVEGGGSRSWREVEMDAVCTGQTEVRISRV